MTEKEIQDGKLAAQIFKKHLKNIKEEFLQNGFELLDIKGINGSFDWYYINNKDHQ